MATTTSHALSGHTMQRKRSRRWHSVIWSKQQRRVGVRVQVAATEVDGTEGNATAKRDLHSGETVIEVDGDDCISIADAQTVEAIAEGMDEVVALGTYLAWCARDEGAEKADPKHADLSRRLIGALGEGGLADPPLLWDSGDREELLAGSKSLNEVKRAEERLWQEFQAMGDAAPVPFQEFMRGASAALAFGWPLASAGGILVIVPGLEPMERATDGPDGSDANVDVDFDAARGKVVARAVRDVAKGVDIVGIDNQALPIDKAFALRGRLPYRKEGTGRPERGLGDHTEYAAELVEADPLREAKSDILQYNGLEPEQAFPVFGDKVPAQLFSHQRLARVQDSGELPKVRFDADELVSQFNEYEALQRLLADFRERLYSFPKPGEEEEMRISKNDKARLRECLAAELRLREKIVLRDAMMSIREKLAPIRGVPTKSGEIKDPNADLHEIFETLENPLRKPREVFRSLFGGSEQS